VQQLDLGCIGGAKLGMLGSFWFAGWIISSLIVPTLADSKGRQNIFLTGIFVNTITITIMIFSRNFWLTGFCLLVNGLTVTSRWAVGYILLLEFLPETTQSLMGGVLQACGAMPLVLGTIISMTTHDTKWILITLVTLNVIGLICVLAFKIVPESPAWLYSVKKYDACREVLAKIALTNNHEGNGEKLAQIIKQSKF
jgi:MFS family permease